MFCNGDLSLSGDSVYRGQSNVNNRILHGLDRPKPSKASCQDLTFYYRLILAWYSVFDVTSVSVNGAGACEISHNHQ